MNISKIVPLQVPTNPPRCALITKPGVRYITPAQCQNSASYLLDGVAMCQRHAQVTIFEQAMKSQGEA